VWRSSDDIDAVVDAVMASGVIRVHATESDAHVALAEIATTSRNVIVMAADNASAKTINTLTRHEKEYAGLVEPKVGSFGRLNEPMGIGDVIQTRRNDNQMGVINRQRWIIDEINPDGGMRVHRADKPTILKTLSTEYVKEHVHRADVVTVHAAQGATADAGHALLDDTWTREQAYVALTRGKNANILHVVAGSDDELRDTLRGVLTSSDRTRSEALTKLVTRRTLEQRTDTTPTLAERINKALRIDRPRVGAWGSASVVSSSVNQNTPVTPLAKPSPEPPSR
jgi:ATP-dependent exoDNAse (exonuclease V) alpha subunit